jgi:hypothetical protein
VHNPSQLVDSLLDEVRGELCFCTHRSPVKATFHGLLSCQIITKYAGKEKELQAKLQKRYGAMPDIPYIATGV